MFSGSEFCSCCLLIGNFHFFLFHYLNKGLNLFGFFFVHLLNENKYVYFRIAGARVKNDDAHKNASYRSSINVSFLYKLNTDRLDSPFPLLVFFPLDST